MLKEFFPGTKVLDRELATRAKEAYKPTLLSQGFQTRTASPIDDSGLLLNTGEEESELCGWGWHSIFFLHRPFFSLLFSGRHFDYWTFKFYIIVVSHSGKQSYLGGRSGKKSSCTKNRLEC